MFGILKKITTLWLKLTALWCEREGRSGKLKLKQTNYVKYAKQYKRHFVDGLCVHVVAVVVVVAFCCLAACLAAYPRP